MKIEARPWEPKDLIDDLQEMIDEEPDRYLNDRRTTLCMARDYLKKYFSTREGKTHQPPCYLPEENNPYPLCKGRGMKACAHCCLWKDYAPEEDEGRINPPLPLKTLKNMVGRPVLCRGVRGKWQRWMIVGRDCCEDGKGRLEYSGYWNGWVAHLYPLDEPGTKV